MAEQRRERLVTQGGNEIVTGAPEDFAALIRADLQSYARLIKQANIPAQQFLHFLS